MIHVITPVSRPHLLPHLASIICPQLVTWHLLFSTQWTIPQCNGGHNNVHFYHTPPAPKTDACYSKLNQGMQLIDVARDDWVHVLGDDDGIDPDFYSRLELDTYAPDVDVVFVPVRWLKVHTRPVTRDNIAVGYIGLQQPIARAWVKLMHPYEEENTSADGLHAVALRDKCQCAFRTSPEIRYNEYEQGREWANLP
jgi:hypothetical protein